MKKQTIKKIKLRRLLNKRRKKEAKRKIIAAEHIKEYRLLSNGLMDCFFQDGDRR